MMRSEYIVIILGKHALLEYRDLKTILKRDYVAKYAIEGAGLPLVKVVLPVGNGVFSTEQFHTMR